MITFKAKNSRNKSTTNEIKDLDERKNKKNLNIALTVAAIIASLVSVYIVPILTLRIVLIVSYCALLLYVIIINDVYKYWKYFIVPAIAVLALMVFVEKRAFYVDAINGLDGDRMDICRKGKIIKTALIKNGKIEIELTPFQKMLGVYYIRPDSNKYDDKDVWINWQKNNIVLDRKYIWVRFFSNNYVLDVYHRSVTEDTFNELKETPCSVSVKKSDTLYVELRKGNKIYQKYCLPDLVKDTTLVYNSVDDNIAVNISTIPNGSNLIIENDKYRVSGRTPFKRRIPRGRYNIILSKSGYYTQIFKINAVSALTKAITLRQLNRDDQYLSILFNENNRNEKNNSDKYYNDMLYLVSAEKYDEVINTVRLNDKIDDKDKYYLLANSFLGLYLDNIKDKTKIGADVIIYCDSALYYSNFMSDKAITYIIRAENAMAYGNGASDKREWNNIIIEQVGKLRELNYDDIANYYEEKKLIKK